MIAIPIVNTNGEKVGAEQLDPALLGGKVRLRLLKQAIVAYRANLRQGTVQTRNRSMVAGSTRKLYRQKGTGRARAGMIRTPSRVGGGRAFPKSPRDFSQPLSRRARRIARNSAILAKALSGSAMIVQGLTMEAPKTASLARILKAARADRGALLALGTPDRNLWLSGRNIPGFEMKLMSEVNAYDVLRARNLLFTPEAFKALLADPQKAGLPAQA